MLLHMPLSNFMLHCLTNSRARSKAYSFTLCLWSLLFSSLFSLQQPLSWPQGSFLTQPRFQCPRPTLFPAPKSMSSSGTSSGSCSLGPPHPFPTSVTFSPTQVAMFLV